MLSYLNRNKFFMIRAAVIQLAIALIVTTSFISSCAVEPKVDPDSTERRLLDAYLSVVHLDTLNSTPSGAYVMERKRGSGAEVQRVSFVFAKYSKVNLFGEYEQTNIEEVAKWAGGYAEANYYGPTLFEIGAFTQTKGMEEALLGKREGADLRIILPSWSSRLDFPNSDKQQVTTAIYDFIIEKVVLDYWEYEKDSLEGYSAKYYGGIDSLKKGFYFKELAAGNGEAVKDAGRQISCYYVGRLLDGFVFDTNIEDTARKYKIYDSSRDYNPMRISIEDDESVEEGSDSGVVTGFAEAISRMNFGGKGVTFFSSEWGYGNSTQSFGKRQPLSFYIEILKE